MGQKILGKARSLKAKVKSIFSGVKLSAERLEELEELLIKADFGRETTELIIERTRETHMRNPDLRSADIVTLSCNVLRELLAGSEGRLSLQSPPETICLLGVNGSGKTTAAAKLAVHLSKMGHSVLLGSCDTFRAAANEQISLWAQNVGAEIVQSSHGADAAATAFDALSAAIARKKDFLVLDTAGRLHTKANLLEELAKMQRVLLKRLSNGTFHRWLVIDGHWGTNSLRQAEIFHGAVQLTGIIVTKLDGSARGGAIVPIFRQLKLPIYFIGTGEGADDLREFSVEEYLELIANER
ncbi:MAG: signal recognition particle-docking protein FtsY [Puniceicoccales bacterium]|nr:signal recognition particle-docking protein FtsY [Puniceicoccales bacterium]